MEHYLVSSVVRRKYHTIVCWKDNSLQTFSFTHTCTSACMDIYKNPGKACTKLYTKKNIKFMTFSFSVIFIITFLVYFFTIVVITFVCNVKYFVIMRYFVLRHQRTSRFVGILGLYFFPTECMYTLYAKDEWNF